MDTSDHASVRVEEGLVPGASVTAVARRHDVNANLLLGWRRLHKQGSIWRRVDASLDHLSILQRFSRREGSTPCIGRWRPVAQRAVRSDTVVVSPLFNEHRSLPQRTGPPL